MTELFDRENEALELTDEQMANIVGGKTVMHVKHGSTHLYAGPGTDYSRVATVYPDDDLVCVGEAKKDKHSKMWFKVRANGVVGWVDGKKVK